MRWLTLTLVALTLTLTLSARAATLEATLIRASNESQETDPRLKDLEPKLRKLFGFQHYQQLGRQNEPLQADGRKLLNLGEGFTMFITPKVTENKTHKIVLEWYSGKTSLLKSTVKLSEAEPVLIKGPPVGKDWIVLALTVKP